MEFKTITVEMDGVLGSLTLNRPDKLNALSVQMIHEITQAAMWFNSQPYVRAVVVSGRGRAFSAGADLAGFIGEADAEFRRDADGGRIMAEAVERMSAVTVAAIHGVCIGGALVLAAACDLRLASETTRFSIPEVDLGIPLAWGGIPRLVREIGPGATKELVMTCREFSAAEAQALGFLNQVLPESEVAAGAKRLAEVVASKPRNAVSATKTHVDAVTAQMVGTGRAWSDADGLIAAFFDPEANESRRRYLADHGR